MRVGRTLGFDFMWKKQVVIMQLLTVVHTRRGKDKQALKTIYQA